MLFRFVSLATIALGLAGCVAVWGENYKVEFASPTSITINFDPGMTNMGEVQHVAQKHCAQFGKDAVPGASQDSMWDLRTTSFDCKSRQ